MSLLAVLVLVLVAIGVVVVPLSLSLRFATSGLRVALILLLGPAIVAAWYVLTWPDECQECIWVLIFLDVVLFLAGWFTGALVGYSIRERRRILRDQAEPRP